MNFNHYNYVYDGNNQYQSAWYSYYQPNMALMNGIHPNVSMSNRNANYTNKFSKNKPQSNSSNICIEDYDMEAEYVVFGYIRELKQTHLSLQQKQNIYYNMPRDVKLICLSFYNKGDKWDEYNIGKWMTITNNHIVINNKDDYRTALLTKTISTGWKYCWRFQIISGRYNEGIDIGIWKINSGSSSAILDTFFTKKFGNGYSFIANKGRLLKLGTSGGYGRHYGVQCKNGDTVDMYLDLKVDGLCNLAFAINDIDYGTAFDNVMFTEYKAAVSINGRGDGIKLISFSKYK